MTLGGLEGKFFVPVAMIHRVRAQGSLLIADGHSVVVAFLFKKVQHDDPWLPPGTARIRSGLTWALRRAEVVSASWQASYWRSRAASPPWLGKRTFMPTMDEGDIIVGIEKLPFGEPGATAELDLKIHAGADEGRARSPASSRGPAPTRSASIPWPEPDRHLPRAEATAANGPQAEALRWKIRFAACSTVAGRGLQLHRSRSTCACPR